MHPNPALAGILVMLALPLMPAGPTVAAPLDGMVIDVAAGRPVSRAAVEAVLRGADVVILGEVHDNPVHHALQSDLVAAIKPAGLAFEMLRPSDEAVVAKLRRQGAPAPLLGAAIDWEARGWPDFGLYAPIFSAAPEAEITGGAVTVEALRAAMEDGAASAAPDALGVSARRYRLDIAYDTEIVAEATADQVLAHCGAIPEAVGRRMVEAQRLRDAAFADAVLRARALGDDGRVVLIAGAGHGRIDRGVPVFLETASPGLSVVSVAFVEVEADIEDWQAYAGSRPLYDFLWFTPAHPREDPCIAFRQSRSRP